MSSPPIAAPVRFRLFARNEDRSLYQQYLALKYEVFVAEQGWATLADPSGQRIVREEPFDEHGWLCLARTPEGDPVAVVRGIALSKGFPHRELLEHHFRRAEVQGMWGKLCTLNALAVLPSYRRKVYEAVHLGWKGNAAKLLMLFVIQQMERRGMQAALTTTGSIVSTRLCRRLGFFVIDPPTRAVHLHPNIMATNVGMVFGSPSHLRAQQDSAMPVEAGRPLATGSLRLLRYFEDRQAEVLKAGGIDAMSGC